MRHSKSLKTAVLVAGITLVTLLAAIPASLPGLKFRISSNGSTVLDIDLRKFSDPDCIVSLQFSKNKNFSSEIHKFTLGSAIFKKVSLNFQFEGIPYSADNQQISSIHSRLHFNCENSSENDKSFYSAWQTLSLSKITKAKKVSEDKFFNSLVGRRLAVAARKSRSDFTSAGFTAATTSKTPVLTSQLLSKSFLSNEDIVFRVGADGARAIKYEWFFIPAGSTQASKLKQKFGLEIISDHKGSTLIIRAALIDTTLYNNGSIYAVAYNKYGQVRSDTAQITVISETEPTLSPSPFATPSQTATIIASPTASPSRTSTAIFTSTRTATSVPTSNRTPTGTPSATRTAFPSATATRTVSRTTTPAASSTASATSTNTPAATQTALATMTSLPTISPTAPVSSSSCSKISQYGITWTFDKGYECGRFYNGDWWVKGPVVVTDIDPKPDYVKGRNGSYINPDPDPSNSVTSSPTSTSSSKQPYDNRPNSESHPGSNATAAYSATYGAFKTLPQTVDIQSSIVSSVSGPEIGTENEAKCGLPGDKGLGLKSTEIAYNFCDTASIKTAAVLTVLGNIPADRGATVFRPPYAGTRKPLYSIQNLNFNLIPSIPAPSGLNYNIDEYIRSTERVHLDHTWDHPTRNLHPYDNMPAYGSAVVRLYGDALLIAATSGVEEKRRKLVSNLIQIGIDNHELVQNGQKWPANGGHSSGRKIVILFAGMMLGNNEILATGQIPTSTNTFSEDCQIYGTESSPSYGLRYCSRGDTSTSYRTVNSNAWRGQVLAAENYYDASGKSLKDYWNHPAVFSWVHKWYNNKANDLVNHRSTIADAYWAQYQNGFPRQ